MLWSKHWGSFCSKGAYNLIEGMTSMTQIAAHRKNKIRLKESKRERRDKPLWTAMEGTVRSDNSNISCDSAGERRGEELREKTLTFL